MSSATLHGIDLLEALPDACLITDSAATVRHANSAAAALLGRRAGSLEGALLTDLVGDSAREAVDQQLPGVEHDRLIPGGEMDLQLADGTRRHVQFSVSRPAAAPELLVWLLRDGTRHWQEDQRLHAWLGLLRLLSERRDLDSALIAALHYLQELAGCEAAGLRLEEDEDYPYFTTEGFPERFTVSETHLCVRDPDGSVVRDRQDRPVLACMCGCVIRGRIDPSLPFFTRGGSFWTNSTTKLLATTSDDDRLVHTRNTCNREGYESVALVPLRKNDQTFGLIQLNDHHSGRFTPELIELLEELSGFVAGALA